MSTLAGKDLLRFQSRTDDSAGIDACWPWLGGRDKDGYGKFRLQGQHLRAHRVAYELASGTAPRDLHVLHHCDNPPCVNPVHLWLGTNTDNRRDCRDKERLNLPSGEDSATAKLTEREVHDIRGAEDRSWGWQRRLARKHGVSEALISMVLSRKVWAHV